MPAAGAAHAAPMDLPTFQSLLDSAWDQFYAIHPLEAGLLLAPLGLVFLLYGFRLYKWLVSVVFAFLGAALGGVAAAGLGWNAMFGMIAGALVLGLLAWPLHRAGWGLLGGGLFGGAAFLALAARATDPVLAVVLAAVASVGGFVLTIFLMRPLIIMVTAVIGAAALVEAVLRLSLLAPSFGGRVVGMMEDRPAMLAILVAIVAATGFLLQWRDTSGAARAAAKKPPSKGQEKDE
ncbi:MAG: hypothetical protein FJ288_09380 [Planctomycetes bacterium]|nr:hypothetical protein [Planctomycetota bacterium]